MNEQKLEWCFSYTAEKLIPLIIQYENENGIRILEPIKVNRTRRKAFNDYFEVSWKKLTNEDLSDLKEYVTLEKVEIFGSRYPKLVEEFKISVEIKNASSK